MDTGRRRDLSRLKRILKKGLDATLWCIIGNTLGILFEAFSEELKNNLNLFHATHPHATTTLIKCYCTNYTK